MLGTSNSANGPNVFIVPTSDFELCVVEGATEGRIGDWRLANPDARREQVARRRTYCCRSESGAVDDNRLLKRHIAQVREAEQSGKSQHRARAHLMKEAHRQIGRAHV